MLESTLDELRKQIGIIVPESEEPTAFVTPSGYVWLIIVVIVDSVRIRPFRTRTHHVIGNNNNTNNNSSSSSSGGGEGGHVTLNTQQFTLLRIIRIGRRRHVSAMLRTHTTIYGLVWWVSLYRYFQCIVVGLALSIATLSLAWIGKGRPQGRLNITILCRSSTSFYAALDGYIQALWFCCCCLSSIFDSKTN